MHSYSNRIFRENNNFQLALPLWDMEFFLTTSLGFWFTYWWLNVYILYLQLWLKNSWVLKCIISQTHFWSTLDVQYFKMICESKAYIKDFTGQKIVFRKPVELCFINLLLYLKIKFPKDCKLLISVFSKFWFMEI